MLTKEEVVKRASGVLGKVWQDYKDQGLISIYLWGSASSRDFDYEPNDIDAIGILSDEADFKKLDKMRSWLPKLDPKLKRLQINFFYLSELKGTDPVRSGLARLYDAEQAVFDFPYWQYVCGQRFSVFDFPKVTPRRVLQHQIELTEIRKGWALNPSDHYGEIGLEYFCKSLAWLCHNIHRLSTPPGPFSWSSLQKEATEHTKDLVDDLVMLKAQGWKPEAIKGELPFLLAQERKLTNKYKEG